MNQVDHATCPIDVDQCSTIYWKNNELATEIFPLDSIKTNSNFTEELAARILATVGKGSYQSDTA